LQETATEPLGIGWQVFATPKPDITTNIFIEIWAVCACVDAVVCGPTLP
jgi:hypothetical protein